MAAPVVTVKVQGGPKASITSLHVRTVTSSVTFSRGRSVSSKASRPETLLRARPGDTSSRYSRIFS